ncbi:hypothetical protein LUZ60_005398 [Juncus effusus]|nr:hypothetical protein LUZ60_005398 [Juncus effusus]
MSILSQMSQEEEKLISNRRNSSARARSRLFKLYSRVPLLKMIASEFIGTFIMIFGAVSSPMADVKYANDKTLITKAASTGIAVAVIMITTGHISGAHLNPSITIALSIVRGFPFSYVPFYIAAQLSSSICASIAVKFIFHDPFLREGVTVPTISIGRAFFLEFVITFILLFVFSSMELSSSVSKKMAGLAVGSTVMLNILIAGPLTGGSMNPARTMGPAIVAGNYESIWIYIVAPIFGAITGTITTCYFMNMK